MSPVRPLPWLLRVLAAGVAAWLAAATGALAVDPLPGLLAGADDPEAQKRAVRERVGALGEAACPTLSAYAGAPDPRVREQAVASLDDTGCDHVEDYKDFFADRSAWV